MNNLYFVEVRGDPEEGWPWKDGDDDVPGPTTMCDLPEAVMLANYLKGLGPAPDASVVEVPPYVNPAGCSEPDVVYALNFLYDFL